VIRYSTTYEIHGSLLLSNDGTDSQADNGRQAGVSLVILEVFYVWLAVAHMALSNNLSGVLWYGPGELGSR